MAERQNGNKDTSPKSRKRVDVQSRKELNFLRVALRAIANLPQAEQRTAHEPISRIVLPDNTTAQIAQIEYSLGSRLPDDPQTEVLFFTADGQPTPPPVADDHKEMGPQISYHLGDAQHTDTFCITREAWYKRRIFDPSGELITLAIPVLVEEGPIPTMAEIFIVMKRNSYEKANALFSQ